jgi:hypothetical protein
MNIRDIMSPARLCVVFVVALLANGAAAAADIPADSLKLAPGVAKAAGYETPATTYMVANSTNVYSGPSLVDTKVTGQLNHGDRRRARQGQRLGMGTDRQERNRHRLRHDIDAVAGRCCRLNSANSSPTKPRNGPKW